MRFREALPDSDSSPPEPNSCPVWLHTEVLPTVQIGSCGRSSCYRLLTDAIFERKAHQLALFLAPVSGLTITLLQNMELFEADIVLLSLLMERSPAH